MSAERVAALAALFALAASQPAAAAAAKGDCRAKDLAGLSGWGGVWIAEHMETAINGRDELGAAPGAQVNPLIMKLAGFEAPWNEEGWTRFETALGAGPNTAGKAAGWGFPVMMSSPAPFKFVISPGETVIASQYREIRYVYTDGRGHPAEADRWPTTWGDSIGCWKGRTLVIETNDVKYSPDFDGLTPPLSDRALFVERLRLTAPARLESDITITDPVTLERPWTVKMVYVRARGIDRLVHDGDIFDNDRTLDAGDTGTIAPSGKKASPPPAPAAKLTQAELDRVAGEYAFDGQPLVLKLERRGQRLFFEVPPTQPVWLPARAEGPLDFSLMGSPVRFTTDEAGRITGFTGKGPDGMPISGKRRS